MELSVEKEFFLVSLEQQLQNEPKERLIEVFLYVLAQTERKRQMNEFLAKRKPTPCFEIEDELRLQALEMKAKEMNAATLRQEILKLQRDNYVIQNEYDETFLKDWGL